VSPERQDAALAPPGAVGISRLRVYDWEGPDGACGGAPHVHLLCTEAYIVATGKGTVQTLGSAGYLETPLEPDTVVWFTPGTIHRLVNHGGLRIFVLMQNAGLPEAGDFVLAFPPEVLADPARYAVMASLAAEDRVFATDERAARRRRDLAVEGFMGLRARVLAEGPAALDGFYAAALRLVAPKLDSWEPAWRAGAVAAVRLTGERLHALRRGDISHLRGATTVPASHPEEERFGMCGHLSPLGLPPGPDGS
jgi:hypothetical protein